jgi:hypothetical protein
MSYLVQGISRSPNRASGTWKKRRTNDGEWMNGLALRICLVAFTIFACCLSTPRAQDGGGRPINNAPQQRIALLFGNSKYNVGPLRNPGNDVRDLSAALEDLNFQVITKYDLTLSEMKRVVREFGQMLRNDSVGLFFYAGHGIQVNGENYIVPVDANINSEEEVEYEALDVGFVLMEMTRARNKMNIVILDACRDNPYSRSFRSSKRGLAPIDAPTGTFIAYATAPGKTAGDGNTGHGVYTQEILKNIKAPGLSIEELFKRVRRGVQAATQGEQIPWDASSLIDDFRFRDNRQSNDSVVTSQGGQPPFAVPGTPHYNAVLTEGFRFHLFNCTLLSDGVECEFEVKNFGEQRWIGISALDTSSTYIVGSNNVRHQATAVSVNGKLNYKNVLHYMRPGGTQTFKLKFAPDLIQMTFIRTLQIDWGFGDDKNFSKKPPIIFENIKPVQQMNLDLGGRPIDPNNLPFRTDGLRQQGLDVSKEGILFRLTGCSLTERGEITCSLEMTNHGDGKRVLISVGGRDGTRVIESHNESEIYASGMRHEIEDKNGVGNFSPTGFNLPYGASHRISLRFSARPFLLPTESYLKEVKLSWSSGELNAMRYKTQSPVKFKDVPLGRTQINH